MLYMYCSILYTAVYYRPAALGAAAVAQRLPGPAARAIPRASRGDYNNVMIINNNDNDNNDDNTISVIVLFVLRRITIIVIATTTAIIIIITVLWYRLV